MSGKCKSAAEAVSGIKSNTTIFIHGAAATPDRLIEGLIERAHELRNVEIIHLHTHGPAKYASPEYAQSFRVTNLFLGGNIRSYFDFDRVDYLPCFLSEMPALFKSGRKKVHAALIHVSPPDKHGYCSLGTSVDTAKAAVETADIVIAQINPRMPRVHGEGLIPLSRINAWIDVDDDLHEAEPHAISENEMKIGHLIAGMIEDGATLQMGIGAIPDATLLALKGHEHLGIHTEMWSVNALELIRSGAVDNSRKVIHTGQTVSTFVMGNKDVYEEIHDNPAYIQLPADEVNNVTVIRQNPKVAAINSAVAVDLTGQVCADSVGSRIISGVGGQMDFIRAASLSKGGLPVIAFLSRTEKGYSKIVPTLPPGSGVVTTRAHVHYIVTEYGIADLYGKTLGERSKALIEIAHPDDREGLERAWFDMVKSAVGRRI
jgi:acyl-CoA hydrolase